MIKMVTFMLYILHHNFFLIWCIHSSPARNQAKQSHKQASMQTSFSYDQTDGQVDNKATGKILLEVLGPLSLLFECLVSDGENY